MAAATVLTAVLVTGLQLSSLPSSARATRSRTIHATAAFTGSTSASELIEGVPVPVLYDGYADLTRMTEWSPLLDSVTVDANDPMHSVWVMRVPRALSAAAGMLGYPTLFLSWEADLVAPGPPCMNWTSTLDEDGKLKGLPEAGFVPAGSVVVEETDDPGVARITLTLKYTLPDAAAWQIALVRSPPVQFVLRSRIAAGLKRFSAAMQREWTASSDAGSSSLGSRVLQDARGH